MKETILHLEPDTNTNTIPNAIRSLVITSLLVSSLPVHYGTGGGDQYLLRRSE